MSRIVFGVFSVLCAAALLGCPGQKKDATPAAASDPAAAPAMDAAGLAKQKFETLCATCHGKEGGGDGPAAASFEVKPRNYKDPEWQKSTTDEELAKVIVEGGPAVGKSAFMPPNPDLKDKPEVVKEIIKLIRGFKAK